MIAIFEKIEKAKVDVFALLQPEEKELCTQLFDKYMSCYEFINGVLTNAVNDYVNHKQHFPANKEDFYYVISKMDKQITNYEEMITDLHEVLARKIERYFSEKYTIQFTSYLEKNKPEDVAATYQLENIIENILEQSGNNLIQAGKNQIGKNFQDAFHTTKQQPSLRNNKISLPCYSYSFGEKSSLDYQDKSVLHLLQAISFILSDSTGLPPQFQNQYEEWKEEIDYSIAYPLETDLTIKFFKNRRIDLAFTSAHTAQKFWQHFQLENIVELNNH